MLFSSPHFRRTGLLLAGLVALIGLWPQLRTLRGGWPRGILWVGGGLLVAHAASAVGGLRDGAAPGAVMIGALKGLAGVACVGLLACFWLREHWRSVAGRTLLAVLCLLLAASLIGYVPFVEKAIPLGGNSMHFDPMRISLIWPLRAMTMANGQMIWEHTNIAGFFFALGAVVLTGFLLERRGGRALWVIAGLCLTVVFLTGSRSAWLMWFAGGGLLLLGQPRERIFKIAVMFAISLSVGYAGLQWKAAAARFDAERVAKSGHVAGLVKRGSSGRLASYQVLWDDLEGHRASGRGLAATNRPVGHLMHEHSIYLASLRGGGLIALAAHLLILAAAAWQALVLWRCGIRWPLAVLSAVLAGLLFDRVSVFKLTGHHEFVFHWAAVLTPFVLARIPPMRETTRNPAACFGSETPGSSDAVSTPVDAVEDSPQFGLFSRMDKPHPREFSHQMGGEIRVAFPILRGGTVTRAVG